MPKNLAKPGGHARACRLVFVWQLYWPFTAIRDLILNMLYQGSMPAAGLNWAVGSGRKNQNLLVLSELWQDL